MRANCIILAIDYLLSMPYHFHKSILTNRAPQHLSACEALSLRGRNDSNRPLHVCHARVALLSFIGRDDNDVGVQVDAGDDAVLENLAAVFGDGA